VSTGTPDKAFGYYKESVEHARNLFGNNQPDQNMQLHWPTWANQQLRAVRRGHPDQHNVDAAKVIAYLRQQSRRELNGGGV
jgi:hypothetical protein